MTASEDITSAENALRDLIESVLAPALRPNWLESSGLTPERLDIMRGRVAAETASRPGGLVEQRLIYYSDLPDLKTIIRKHWERFKPCLGDQRTCYVNLDRLNRFRNAQMHGRQLLPFEQALTAGISGEFRNRVALFRSERGPSREYFPRIEYVRDSFGNVRHGHGTSGEPDKTDLILHPGDEISFECHAWDPDNVPFTWSVQRWTGGYLLDHATSPEFVWRVTAEDIADPQRLIFRLTSARAYHRDSGHDDTVILGYRVLPPD